MSTTPPIDREWTQEELKTYLVAHGWLDDDFDGEPIPQGVKYIDFSPLTEADIERAKQLLEAEQRRKVK